MMDNLSFWIEHLCLAAFFLGVIGAYFVFHALKPEKKNGRTEYQAYTLPTRHEMKLRERAAIRDAIRSHENTTDGEDK